jgi:hypothetical protein
VQCFGKAQELPQCGSSPSLKICVEICSLRYPTRFTLIAHLKYPGLKQRKEVKKLVLNVWFGAHLQEIHCCCQQKVCSVNGLIMGGVVHQGHHEFWNILEQPA